MFIIQSIFFWGALSRSCCNACDSTFIGNVLIIECWA